MKHSTFINHNKLLWVLSDDRCIIPHFWQTNNMLSGMVGAVQASSYDKGLNIVDFRNEFQLLNYICLMFEGVYLLQSL